MAIVGAYSIFAALWLFILGHYLKPIYSAIRARKSAE